jgi:hypothetical protein
VQSIKQPPHKQINQKKTGKKKTLVEEIEKKEDVLDATTTANQVVADDNSKTDEKQL